METETTVILSQDRSLIDPLSCILVWVRSSPKVFVAPVCCELACDHLACNHGNLKLMKSNLDSFLAWEWV